MSNKYTRAVRVVVWHCTADRPPSVIDGNET